MHRVRICKGRTTYMPTLDHLQRSFQCGRLVLKNRITAAPIFTGLEFKPNLSELTKFYVHLAEDGVSMVTICAGLVHSSGAPSDNWYVFNEDIDVPRHRALNIPARLYCSLYMQDMTRRAGPRGAQTPLNLKTEAASGELLISSSRASFEAI